MLKIDWCVFARDRLNETFANHWIERYGPISWPSRSPYVTQYDYFVWVFIKDHLYAINVKFKEELSVKKNRKERLLKSIIKFYAMFGTNCNSYLYTYE